MTEQWRPDNSARGAAEPDSAAACLAADWVTIWQSEMAGLAVDREAAEHMQAALAGWLAASAAMRAFSDDRSRGFSGTGTRSDAAPRSAPAAAPPDAGDVIAALERRVAELERRLLDGASAA